MPVYVSSGPTNDRQRAVVGAFKHAWKAYTSFAWGHDHLKPISQQAHDWFGLGLTIVDSLDTMYIMNLKEGQCREYTIIIGSLTGERLMVIFPQLAVE